MLVGQRRPARARRPGCRGRARRARDGGLVHVRRAFHGLPPWCCFASAACRNAARARHSGQLYCASYAPLNAHTRSTVPSAIVRDVQHARLLLARSRPLRRRRVSGVTFSDADALQRSRHRERSSRWPPKAPSLPAAPATGRVDGQGAEEERDRLRLEHRHRRRLDGARLLARGDARLHRRRSRASATHAPAVLLASFVPMLLISLGLPLPQQRRPGRRHDVRVDDARIRPRHRMAQRLGDLPRRRARDGLARRTSPPPTPSSCSDGLGRNAQRRRHSSAASCGSLLMTWICYRGIELSARIQQLLLSVRGRDARDLLGRRARRRSTRAPPPRTRSSRRLAGSTRSR